MRSTWSAVPARPTANSRSSVSGVATRVRARTLAYESSPRARAWASSGSVPRARATRTRSRAAPRSSPTRQLSQAAQERNPVFQPSRASNARMRSRRRAVAASRWADSSAISSLSRSSESVSMASLPSAGATLHPSFGAAWEARRTAIAAPLTFFATNAPMVASAGFHGPLAPSLSGVADTRRQPTQKAVKRKSQASRRRPQPLPRKARPYQKLDAEPQRLSNHRGTIALEFAYRFPERLHTVTTAERRTGTG